MKNYFEVMIILDAVVLQFSLNILCAFTVFVQLKLYANNDNNVSGA